MKFNIEVSWQKEWRGQKAVSRVGGVLHRKDSTHQLLYIWGGGLHFISSTMQPFLQYLDMGTVHCAHTVRYGCG